MRDCRWQGREAALDGEDRQQHFYGDRPTEDEHEPMMPTFNLLGLATNAATMPTAGGTTLSMRGKHFQQYGSSQVYRIGRVRAESQTSGTAVLKLVTWFLIQAVAARAWSFMVSHRSLKPTLFLRKASDWARTDGFVEANVREVYFSEDAGCYQETRWVHKGCFTAGPGASGATSNADLVAACASTAATQNKNVFGLTGPATCVVNPTLYTSDSQPVSAACAADGYGGDGLMDVYELSETPDAHVPYFRTANVEVSISGSLSEDEDWEVYGAVQDSVILSNMMPTVETRENVFDKHFLGTVDMEGGDEVIIGDCAAASGSTSMRSWNARFRQVPGRALQPRFSLVAAYRTQSTLKDMMHRSLSRSLSMKKTAMKRPITAQRFLIRRRGPLSVSSGRTLAQWMHFSHRASWNIARRITQRPRHSLRRSAR